MKKILVLLALFLSGCSTLIAKDSPTPTSKPPLVGPYLGQALPESEPVVFGQAFLRGGYHSSPTFLPDGSEMYWAGNFSSAKIYFVTEQGGSWTDQQTLSLQGGFVSVRDPFISPDGKHMYFLSPAPLPGSMDSGKENIWVVNREGTEWGKPEPLPDAVNHRDLHWTISVANNGNLYISSGSGGIGDIYKSVFADGIYSEPEKLPFPINDEVQIETTPNIAPDESYILFSRMATTNDTSRLFISYAIPNGWTEPIMVENIASCISPMITPDRKFVFCLADPFTLIWRDTSFIDELRPRVK